MPKNSCKNQNKAFTLIELLVVIGILSVLLAIVLVAINPVRQFAQADNTKRRSDVNAILNAVHQYAVDNAGNLPAQITSTSSNMASNTSGGSINFCAAIVPTYIAEMPVDPDNGTWTSCTSYDSGYEISVSATNNRVTVTSPDAELSETITVTR